MCGVLLRVCRKKLMDYCNSEREPTNPCQLSERQQQQATRFFVFFFVGIEAVKKIVKFLFRQFFFPSQKILKGLTGTARTQKMIVACWRSKI